MRVTRISIPYDCVLALNGPDPTTGLFEVYVRDQTVPIGNVAQIRIKEVGGITNDSEADHVIKNFNDTGVDTLNGTTVLRNSDMGTYLDGRS